VDGDLVLFESMAINLYLAKTYGGKLYPSDPHDEARAIQWTIWGMTELEPHLIPMVLHKVFLPEDQRDPAVVTKGEADIQRPLGVLDAHVSDREYLLGGDFTIADLNVAGALSTAAFVNFDYSKFENAARWMSRCTGRPSFARTGEK
jgi:glutathione S-transferase